jgi:uncharacterized protein (TIGR02118 family)
MREIADTSYSSISIPRRRALALGAATAAGLVVGAGAHAEDASGGIKITVLYGAPKDPKEFEKHYSEVHMPMVYSVKELKRVELSVGLPDPDGKAPAFYRITELWFENPEQLQKAAATSIWKKIVDDVPTFASGGVTIVTSKIG